MRVGNIEAVKMAINLEEVFLEACKVGDIETVKAALQQNVNVNYQQGWALRRAVRYNHTRVWQQLLAHPSIQLNLVNQFGLTALHTACRFNIPGAVFDLLRHPAVAVNMKTTLGSSPIAVAAKYCGREALEMIIRDRRVDLDIKDNQDRTVEDVVGVAIEDSETKQEDVKEILESLAEERQRRKEEEGRRDSMEEENIDVDGLHRLKVFDKIKELVSELRELHRNEMTKLRDGQEAESQQFMEKLERDVMSLLQRQEEEQAMFINKLKNDKLEFDQRQHEELGRLLKKQEQETLSLQGTKSRQSEQCTSPKNSQTTSSRSNSRRPSLKTAQEVASCETMSDSSSGPSLWDWNVPDEGYCTGKDGELPLMIDSARKELECPICYEIMAPPSRIWQCRQGHVICEPCKERVRPPGGLATNLQCPTCKTAPFIGRNLALERISQKLFALK